jgi:hypothetical protein
MNPLFHGPSRKTDNQADLLVSRRWWSYQHRQRRSEIFACYYSAPGGLVALLLSVVGAMVDDPRSVIICHNSRQNRPALSAYTGGRFLPRKALTDEMRLLLVGG